MKSNNKSHSSKLNIFLVIAALLALVITVITVSYSWIESANTLNINNNGAEGHKISVNVSNPGVAQITEGNSDEVALSQYIDNIGSLFLAPAKIDASGNLTIKRASGDYTAATTNDIGNNYIEFDVPFTVNKLYKFSFSEDSAITFTGGNNPIKVSLSLDGSTANVFDAANIAGQTAFYASAGTTHNLKVRIWLDATTEAEATALAGQTIGINLTLVPSTDIGKRNVKLAESPYAIVTATYTDSEGHQQTMNEGDTVAVLPNTEFKLTAVTANGKLITSGSNMDLNGHQFSSFVAKSGTMGTSEKVSEDTTAKTRTDKATYTVGDKDVTITTNTSTDTFRLGGESIKSRNTDGTYTTLSWSDGSTLSATMTYNEELNCVYQIVQSTGTNDNKTKFKIASGSTFANSCRDSESYSVSLTQPTIISSGSITGAGFNGDYLNSESKLNVDRTFTYSGPTNTDVMVIYYLDSNEVEMTTDTVLKTHYTATAEVSTTNSNGSATVTYGDTTASSVSVPRRAADKSVTFKATPSSSDYKFVGWSTTNGGTSYVSTDAEYKPTLTGDLTLYANFKRVYTLTITPADKITADGVKFDINQSTNKGTASIVEGTDVNLTASSPNSSNTYKVVWLDNAKIVHTETIGAGQTDDAGQPKHTSRYTISKMSAAHDIIVQYIQLYKLTVQKTGDGASDSNATVSAVIKDAENNTYELSNGVAYVPAGTTAVVTANVAAGGNPYRVSSNVAAGSLNGKHDLIPTSTSAASYTFSTETINANTTISIEFTRLYKLTYSSTADISTIFAKATVDGVEKSVSNGGYLPRGAEVVITTKATDNTLPYEVNWTGLDSATTDRIIPPDTTEATKSFTMPSSDKEVTASYERLYKLTYSQTGDTDNTSVTSDSGSSPLYLKENASATLTASANDSKPYNVTWTVDENNVGEALITSADDASSKTTKEITMSNADKNVVVNFERRYKLSINATNCTYTAVDGNSNAITFTDNIAYVPKNTVPKFTATANDTGHYRVAWNGGTPTDYTDNTVAVSSEYTAPAITSDDTVVTVVFTKLYSFMVKVDSNSHADSNVTVNVSGKESTATASTPVNLFLTAGESVNLTAGNSSLAGDKLSVAWTIDYAQGTDGSGSELTQNVDISAEHGDTTVTALIKEKSARTIYFVNTHGWSDVRAYAWYVDGNGTHKYSEWDKSPTMTKVDPAAKLYSIDIPPEYVNIIFWGKSGQDQKQTVDLIIPDDGRNRFTVNSEMDGNKYKGTWDKYPPDVNKHTIVVDSVTNATLSVTSGGSAVTEVDDNAEITITATNITAGWRIDSFVITNTADGSKVAELTPTNNTASYTVTSDTPSSITVSAVLSEIPMYNITIQDPSNGNANIILNYGGSSYTDNMSASVFNGTTLQETDFVCNIKNSTFNSYSYDYYGIVSNGEGATISKITFPYVVTKDVTITAVLKQNTSMNYYLSGENIEGLNWNDTNKEMTYDKVTNTVTTDIITTGETVKMKITKDGYSNSDRSDSSKCVSVNSAFTDDNILYDASTGITSKNIDSEYKNIVINVPTGSKLTVTYDLTNNTVTFSKVQPTGVTIYLKNDANWDGTPSVHIWSSSNNAAYKSWKDNAEKMTYDDSTQLWTYTLTAEDAAKYDRCQFHVNGSKTTQNLVFQAGYIYNNAALFTWSPKDSSVPNTREITVKMTNDVANADINGKPVYYLFSKDNSNVYSVAISKSYDSSNTYTFIIPADCTTFTIQRKDPRNLTGDAWNSDNIKDVPTDKTTYEITGTPGGQWFVGSWK